MELFIIQVKIALGGFDRSGKNFYQGGFPRSIFANQGMHAPTVKGETDVIQGTCAGIIFGDVFRADL